MIQSSRRGYKTRPLCFRRAASYRNTLLRVRERSPTLLRILSALKPSQRLSDAGGILVVK